MQIYFNINTYSIVFQKKNYYNWFLLIKFYYFKIFFLDLENFARKLHLKQIFYQINYKLRWFNFSIEWTVNFIYRKNIF